MPENDEIRTDETLDEERYDDGVRTDDDGSVDPQEEVEERLKQIEDEQREDDGEDDADGGDPPSSEDADQPDDVETATRADDEGMTDQRSTSDEGSEDADASDEGEDPRFESEEDKRAREEAFAAEHDPEQHDLSAGEEFRQAGDWTAEDGKLTADDVVSGEQGVDGRRLSSVEEIRDGGYGVGSAAPIEDGAMPLDHAVKAWEDTKTYLVQGEDGYDGVDPHVWFLDDRSAERAGFDHAGG